MFWPCETRTSTCRSFATISSGLYRFLAIAVLLDVKDIPQVGPLQWGWISYALPAGLQFLGWRSLFSGEIAGIKGDMTIKLVHPPGEELKFVVELPGEKQMAFSVDRYQIVNLAERWN